MHLCDGRSHLAPRYERGLMVPERCATVAPVRRSTCACELRSRVGVVKKWSVAADRHDEGFVLAENFRVSEPARTMPRDWNKNFLPRTLPPQSAPPHKALARAWRRETPTREEGSLSLLGCGRMGGVEGWGAWGARSRDQQRPSMGARHASSPSPKKRSFLCADLALRQCYVIKIGSEAKKATTAYGSCSWSSSRMARPKWSEVIL